MREPALRPTLASAASAYTPTFASTSVSTSASTFASAAALLLAAGLLVAVLAVPSLASAQMREFTGRIDKVTKKKMIVDNRMGDKVTFIYSKGDTHVEGTKTEWKKLKTKDWVTVSWKFVDKPRKAYKVLVFEKDEDEGEGEDG